MKNESLSKLLKMNQFNFLRFVVVQRMLPFFFVPLARAIGTVSTNHETEMGWQTCELGTLNEK